MMKNFKLIIALLVFASIISCNDKRTRQAQYMPDMYESVPYEADGAKGLEVESCKLKPVNGTLQEEEHPLMILQILMKVMKRQKQL